MKFSEIIEPLEEPLRSFQTVFAQTLKVSTPLLHEIFEHLIMSQGKQIRSILILLSAEISGRISEKTYRSAVLTELLHVATLLHDDVVDQAEFRRNKPSVNAKWGNKTAVLVGDYLFAETLKNAVKHQDYDLLEIMNEAIKQISEGELIQLQNIANTDLSESIYYDIISKKTASLFASSCACGAMSAKADPQTVDLFYQIGWHLGMAFQMKDDLLDFLPNAETGKIKGNDLREQKLTLPLIHFLSIASPIERNTALDIIQNHHQTVEKTELLFQAVLKSESVLYTDSKIAEHIEKSNNLLNRFPESIYKTTLQKLMNFMAFRTY